MTAFFNLVTKGPVGTFVPRIKLPAIKREKGANHHIARVNVLMCTLSIQYRVCDWLRSFREKKIIQFYQEKKFCWKNVFLILLRNRTVFKSGWTRQSFVRRLKGKRRDFLFIFRECLTDERRPSDEIIATLFWKKNSFCVSFYTFPPTFFHSWTKFSIEFICCAKQRLFTCFFFQPL